MINFKEKFHDIFIMMNHPSYIKEDFTYEVFEEVLVSVAERIEESGRQQIPDSVMIFSYIIGEFTFVFSPISEEKINELIKNEEFKKSIINRIIDKIFFNEYASFKAVTLIDKYNPIISTLRFYLNFILDRFTVIKTDNKADLIVLGMLRKAFLSCRSITTLLTEGFETEAFSTWRTLHEIECIAKIIFDSPYLSDTYERHLVYNQAFRNEFVNKDEQQIIIDEIKSLLKMHELKSKDLKKYIEYGWLYSIKNVNENYPTLKLNFRNGVEVIAGLSSYSKLYEMSSEIAHSSPILIYSNKSYFLKTSLTCLYETFLRIEKIFFEILKRSSSEDSSGFYNLRNTMLNELNILHIKIKNMSSKL